MTIRDLAQHLNVGWALIKDIQKRDLSRRYAKPKLKHLQYIAISERLHEKKMSIAHGRESRPPIGPGLSNSPVSLSPASEVGGGELFAASHLGQERFDVVP